MAKRFFNNIKLGVFVVAGLLFLILLLYMIGKNRHLFGANYLLTARFENVQGLKPGHNVRYAGIEIGTVKKVSFLNDTIIEITMLIDNKMKSVIRKNAIVSVGTEGFVGNKVVNIVPGKGEAAFAVNRDQLLSKKPVDTDEMLRTLYKTNGDIAVITDELKQTVRRVNASDALWKLLNEKSVPENIRQAANNIRKATAGAATITDDLQEIAEGIKNGKGTVGAILTDSLLAGNLKEAFIKVNLVAGHLDSLSGQVAELTASLKNDLNDGKGVANALLKDSVLADRLSRSLDHIEKGTDAFRQDMEALKHNFLLRGYFKKLEKQKRKDQNKKIGD